jgi:hypothetical protein
MPNGNERHQEGGSATCQVHAPAAPNWQRMTAPQQMALRYPCRLTCESMHPRYATRGERASVILTVDATWKELEPPFLGPVWHASACMLPGFFPQMHFLHAVAYAALGGVGYERKGEWEQWSGRCFHVWRRLSDEEERSIGPVRRRHTAMLPFCPQALAGWSD